jgi:multicomponent Na+:H+ antiporter subunit F
MLTTLILGILLLAMVLAFVRMVIGPTLADRVASLDLMSVLVSGILGASAVVMDEPVLIDIAIVGALIAFLSTVAFSRYIVKRTERERSARNG